METVTYFVPPKLILFSSILSTIAVLLISTLVFLRPALDIRRNYDLTNCTATSATLSCFGECRLINVTSSAFPFAEIQLDGRGNAPCSTIAECDESFPCRFRNDSGVLLVRENVSSTPVGFILFLVLAIIIAIASITYALSLGWQPNPVRLVLFLPPAMDIENVSATIGRRWPIVEARSLVFNYETHQADEDAKRAFDTPWSEKKRGVVFAVTATASHYNQILAVVPGLFYRVLIMPPLSACLASNSAMARCLVHDSECPRDRTCEDRIKEAYTRLEVVTAMFDAVCVVPESKVADFQWIAKRTVPDFLPFRVVCWSTFARITDGIWGGSSKRCDKCWLGSQDDMESVSSQSCRT
ncbi:hypothetical protein BWQ96_04845 [Gracilariopsis chorda]|uniref:Uncharacterized protein n=1 Tax=Gracilariopsis chorda TaxID=448386 RepID=A0A2V3IWB9_9FLOR|nr:hypothetical protein BWQ96_04845 [Gracilariopsis chorda]|eukprot:PXF45430.1 hypothetical protein BWQ96_04845 [Gracilariopsis chorda]